MELHLSQCLLRPLLASDAASIAAHANDRAVWITLRDRFPHPYTPADAEGFLAYIASNPSERVFAIVIAGQAVGSVSLVLGLDVERRSAELGYWLGCAFWGRGIMTEVVRAVTKFAIDELQLVRVFAVPFATNPASARLLEKAGYVREATMRRSAIKDDKIIDQWLYAFVVE